MAEEEQTSGLIIVAIIAVAFFLIFSGGGGSGGGGNGDADKMEIVFEARSKTGQKLAVLDSGQGMQFIPNAQGRFGVAVKNTGASPLKNIINYPLKDEWSEVDDTPFENANFSWGSVNINSGERWPYHSSEYVYTSWFDLEWYAHNQSGETDFYFTFEYNYTDAEGKSHIDSMTKTISITIIKDTCPDGTTVGQCTGDGQRCTISNGDVVAIDDQGCCEDKNFDWNGTACDTICGPISANECLDVSQVPSGEAVRETWCNPTTEKLEQNCQECVCWDIYGNASVGCNGAICEFANYSVGAMGVSVGGSGQAESITEIIAEYADETNFIDTAHWVNFDRIIDGEWLTWSRLDYQSYGGAIFTSGELKYNRNPNAVSVDWEIKTSDAWFDKHRITLPMVCFLQDPIQLKIDANANSNANIYYFIFYCHDGLSYKNLGNINQSQYLRFYEEALVWKVPI